MKGWLSFCSDGAYALMRVVVGVMFALHGADKLFGVFSGHSMPLMSQMGAAGGIETVTGLLVALGIFTGPAAFIASGEMAVAYFQAHAPHGFWPIQNKGELAVLYCFIFLFIAFRGSGRWAVMKGRR